MIIGSYEFPEDMLFDPLGEVWLRRQDDGSLVLGLTVLSCDFAGDFAIFTPKPAGREYDAGGSIGLLETCKTVGAIKTPVSVRIIESNIEVERTPILVNRAPYTAGWLFRLEALAWEDERSRLVDIAGLAARYAQALARMKELRDA
ncbi:MAG: glycine cleavage system protein H [Betaproteobacteria bacterium]|nr:glycine cleavage system protein H [Betaproteobacteria bacterium]